MLQQISDIFEATILNSNKLKYFKITFDSRDSHLFGDYIIKRNNISIASQVL